MFFWFIATAVTAIACAALYYAAARRTVNATVPDSAVSNSHFRLVLAGIDADQAAGKLGEAEAIAAKGELARELLRQDAEVSKPKAAGPGMGRGALVACIAAVAVMSLGLYGWLGNPNMPSLPLADRPEVAAQTLDLDAAVARIEAQLAANPDDLRGWTVVAPVYTQSGRYADAQNAWRRVLELGGANPDVQTKLAEALMLGNGGDASGEAMQLLTAAAASDPTHVMSRLYIAAELTRTQRYAEAVEAWNAALALSQGDEPWLPAAQQGLAVAQNQGEPAANAAETEMIAQMVTGLADRLAADGGTITEWTQLVRAYLVLGDKDKAQAAFDAAVAAYPKSFDRDDLDAIALEAGLTLNGAAQ